jgi:Zn-dependent M28 family amino/carboxypeptidase
MRFILLLLAAASALTAQVNQIQGSRIRPHVKFLASDSLEGRGPGQRGGQLAVEYIAAQFEAAGLQPAGDNGTYLQKVPLRMVTVDPGAKLAASAGSKTVSFRWFDEFVGTSMTQQPEVEINAPAVFVGHGIRAPEFNWDDYKGVDVKGKVVVLFTGEPPSKDPNFFKAEALTYYGRWTYKFEEATRQGAAGVIIIHTTPTASYGWQVLRSGNRPQPQIIRVPGAPALGFAGWVTTEAGNQLLGLAGKNVAEMLKAADTRGFQAFLLGDVRIKVSMKVGLKDIETYNVIGVAKGSDPKLSREGVLFTAHWDHLGAGEPVKGDSIYNGAVDNATGCAILIEMARAWASLEPRPLRSAYFAAVTSEESGLLGSKYLAEHPPVPAAQVAVDLNFDSFFPYGPVGSAVLTGAERTSFFPVVQNVLQRYKLTLKPDAHPSAGSYFRSDHYPFAQNGIPAFSVEMGEDFIGKPPSFGAEKVKEYSARYHQPSDEYSDAWDFGGMEQFARLGMTLGLEIANLEAIPARVNPN